MPAIMMVACMVPMARGVRSSPTIRGSRACQVGPATAWAASSRNVMANSTGR